MFRNLFTSHEEVTVIVYRDYVICAIEGKDVCGNLLPRTKWDLASWDISVSCCRVLSAFPERRCTSSFLQTCLASRYIRLHAAEMPQFRDGTSESSSSYLLEGSLVSVRDFSMYLWGTRPPARDRNETWLWRFAKFSLSSSVVVFKISSLFSRMALSL